MYDLSKGDILYVKMSSSIRDNGMDLDNLAVYANKNIIELLGDKVNWTAKSGEILGGVVLDYDYGIINVNGKDIPVVASSKIIDDEIHIVDLKEDKIQHPFTYKGE